MTLFIQSSTRNYSLLDTFDINKMMHNKSSTLEAFVIRSFDFQSFSACFVFTHSSRQFNFSPFLRISLVRFTIPLILKCFPYQMQFVHLNYCNIFPFLFWKLSYLPISTDCLATNLTMVVSGCVLLSQYNAFQFLLQETKINKKQIVHFLFYCLLSTRLLMLYLQFFQCKKGAKNKQTEIQRKKIYKKKMFKENLYYVYKIYGINKCGALVFRFIFHFCFAFHSAFVA